MRIQSFVRVALGTAVLGALGAGLVAGAVASLAAVRAPGPATTGELLTLGASVAALVCAATLAWSVGLGLLGRLGGRVGRVAAALDRATPMLVRRLAGVLVGAILGTVALPGSALGGTGVPRDRVSSSVVAADPGRLVPVTAAPGPPTAAPDPLFAPTRPLVRPQPSPHLLRDGGPAQPDGIVVHRGDTLWDIVARALGPDTSDAEVAAAWPTWWAANRDVIGADPDLILPGQVLHAPVISAAPSPEVLR